MILYILLCGTPPFFGKATKDIVAAIKKGVYTLSHKPFQNCSIEVKIDPLLSQPFLGERSYFKAVSEGSKKKIHSFTGL